ncbi:MAG TPA: DUF6559 family protein [Cellvibrionaceae bacterium]
MLNYIKKYKRNRAINDYLYKLGPALVRRYGPARQYTVLQIQKTAIQLKLNMQYIRYAIAMYRQTSSENTLSIYSIDELMLDNIRAEVASAYFQGNMNYTAADIMRLGKLAGWKGGASPNWKANRLGQTSL